MVDHLRYPAKRLGGVAPWIEFQNGLAADEGVGHLYPLGNDDVADERPADAAQWTDDLGRRRGPAARRWAGVALELALVAEGLSNQEIAERLVVSPCTAKTHVSRAMVKLGARDRAQLVAFAYESGLARPGWLD